MSSLLIIINNPFVAHINLPGIQDSRAKAGDGHRQVDAYGAGGIPFLSSSIRDRLSDITPLHVSEVLFRTRSERADGALRTMHRQPVMRGKLRRAARAAVGASDEGCGP